MNEFRFKNRLVNHQCRGRGMPIVLIPGMGGQLSFWKPVVNALSEKFKVITFDYPGSGGSEPLESKFTIERMVELVVSLLAFHNVKSCYLVGQSLGGAIAQQLAEHHPALVEKLVLSCSWAKSDIFIKRSFGLRREILLKLGPKAYARAQTLSVMDPQEMSLNAELADEWEQRTINASDTRSVCERIQAIIDFDNSADLTRIVQPVKVIAARDDRVVPSYLAEALAGGIKDSQLEILDGGGHFIAMTEPDKFVESLMPFLAGPEPVQIKTHQANG